MANVQLGNLGIYGFRADLFGNYDFFDESYDLSTPPTPNGVRLYKGNRPIVAACRRSACLFMTRL